MEELKLKIVELNKYIKIKQLELTSYEKDLNKTIYEYQELCPHDVAEVELEHDYDRSRYTTTCVNCMKMINYGSIFQFEPFYKQYKGKLIGNVPNVSRD